MGGAPSSIGSVGAIKPDANDPCFWLYTNGDLQYVIPYINPILSIVKSPVTLDENDTLRDPAAVISSADFDYAIQVIANLMIYGANITSVYKTVDMSALKQSNLTAYESLRALYVALCCKNSKFMFNNIELVEPWIQKIRILTYDMVAPYLYLQQPSGITFVQNVVTMFTARLTVLLSSNSPAAYYVLSMTRGNDFVYADLINASVRCSDSGKFMSQDICPKYCLSSLDRAKECGLLARCVNGNDSDAGCQSLCASQLLGYPCDAMRLQTFCAIPANMTNPLCKDYCSRKPVECLKARTTYCKSNIMDPQCADFARNTYSVTDSSGVSTSFGQRADLDATALALCDSVKQELMARNLIYPIDYDTISKDPELKKRVDFCSCILSPIGDFGQPGCADTRCQISGWKTQNMVDVACASCMQIINASGSFINISGNMQTMTCGAADSGGGSAVKYSNVPQEMLLAAKYSQIWRTSQRDPASGKLSYTPQFPNLNVALNTLCADPQMVAPPNSGVITDLQFVKFANALGATHVNTIWQWVDFTAAELLNIIFWAQNDAKQFMSFLTYILTHIKNAPDYSVFSADGTRAAKQIFGCLAPFNIYIVINAIVNAPVGSMALYNKYVPMWTSANGAYIPPSHSGRIYTFVNDPLIFMHNTTSFYTAPEIVAGNNLKLITFFYAFVLSTADSNGMLEMPPNSEDFISLVLDGFKAAASTNVSLNWSRFSLALLNMNFDDLPNINEVLVRQFAQGVYTILTIPVNYRTLAMTVYSPPVQYMQQFKTKMLTLCSADVCKSRYVIGSDSDLVSIWKMTMTNSIWNSADHNSKAGAADLVNTMAFIIDTSGKPLPSGDTLLGYVLSGKTTGVAAFLLNMFTFDLRLDPDTPFIDPAYASIWKDIYMTFGMYFVNLKTQHILSTFIKPPPPYQSLLEAAFAKWAVGIGNKVFMNPPASQTEMMNTMMAQLTSFTFDDAMAVVYLYVSSYFWITSSGKPAYIRTSSSSLYAAFMNAQPPKWLDVAINTPSNYTSAYDNVESIQIFVQDMNKYIKDNGHNITFVTPAAQNPPVASDSQITVSQQPPSITDPLPPAAISQPPIVVAQSAPSIINPLPPAAISQPQLVVPIISAPPVISQPQPIITAPVISQPQLIVPIITAPVISQPQPIVPIISAPVISQPQPIITNSLPQSQQSIPAPSITDPLPTTVTSSAQNISAGTSIDTSAPAPIHNTTVVQTQTGDHAVKADNTFYTIVAIICVIIVVVGGIAYTNAKKSGKSLFGGSNSTISTILGAFSAPFM
jgi:hypothetical protein